MEECVSDVFFRIKWRVCGSDLGFLFVLGFIFGSRGLFEMAIAGWFETARRRESGRVFFFSFLKKSWIPDSHVSWFERKQKWVCKLYMMGG